MRRINFLRTRPRPQFEDYTQVDVSARTRRAFVACAAAIAFVSLVSFVESRRIDEVRTQANQAAARVGAADGRLADLRTVTTLLTHLSATAHDVAAVRENANKRLSTIVSIGDHLPQNVWLTSVSADAVSIDLHARAKSTQDVGFAITALDRLQLAASARLVNAHMITNRGNRYVDFEITLVPKADA